MINDFSATDEPQPPVEINACDSNPCQNGVCQSQVDGFSCECSEGFEGDLCQTGGSEFDKLVEGRDSQIGLQCEVKIHD